LKDGILAAKQNLKIQDKPREKKEDELKMSILNARKGLKRATSREEQASVVERRIVTPTAREEPKVEDNLVKVETNMRAREEPPEIIESKPPEIEVAVKSPPTLRSSPGVSLSKPIESVSAKTQLSPTPATVKPSAKPTTSPKPQRAVLEVTPPIQKSLAKQTAGENDSPTPQKKFPKPDDVKLDIIETEIKPLSPKPSVALPVKQISLPLASEPKASSFKGRYFV
jgi:hypothetical protein